MSVELVYEESCPNVAAARRLLEQAFKQSGLTPVWQEWELSDSKVPAHARGYGSPTILVDGVDVSGACPGHADHCCRIYLNNKSENHGVPALLEVVKALHNTMATR